MTDSGDRSMEADPRGLSKSSAAVKLPLVRRARAERPAPSTVDDALSRRGFFAAVGATVTVLTVAAYYMSSTIDFRDGPAIEASAWIYFYPPAWLAGLPRCPR